MKRWYIQYFNIYPRGVCVQCGNATENLFCDIKCSVIFEKDNNLNEIQDLRKKLTARHKTILSLKTPEIRERGLTECDNLARELQKLIDKVSFPVPY